MSNLIGRALEETASTGISGWYIVGGFAVLLVGVYFFNRVIGRHDRSVSAKAKGSQEWTCR